MILQSLVLVGIAAGAPLHPPFPVLDARGVDVLVSGAPYAPRATCGACHDVGFIAEHAPHAIAGSDALVALGAVRGGLPWDRSRGRFGAWDPDLYDVLDPADPASWLSTYGLDHVGGGPAADLGAEMDCLLCHLGAADDTARREALASRRFALAATATLAATGLVTVDLAAPADDPAAAVTWHAERFVDGQWPIGQLPLQPPTAERCGSCHGTVHRSSAPLSTPDGRRSQRTGMVYSGQRIDRSALNLADKAAATRSWDVHAERLLECSTCHYAANNPVAVEEAWETRPEHLRFDGRRMSLGAYLHRPSHAFAKGGDPYGEAPGELQGTMRRCDGCHDPSAGHAWLPSPRRHFRALACTSCHVPKIHWTPREQLDWTSLDTDGAPLAAWRNADGPPDDPTTLHRGYTPTLLPRREADGGWQLAPFHLSTVWLWVAGEPPMPIDRAALRAAWADEAALAPVFDADGDGALSRHERRLDDPAKVALIRDRLVRGGVPAPRIAGELQVHPIHHGVARGRHATRACTTCHGERSLLFEAVEVARWTPGDVRPSFRQSEVVAVDVDALAVQADGSLRLEGFEPPEPRYVFGAHRVGWIDVAGLIVLLATLAGISVHGLFRYVASRAEAPPEPG